MLKYLMITLAVVSTSALADSHNGNGQGFSTITSSTTISGKTGTITHLVTDDIWNYENAPADWPKAAVATCNYTLMIAAGQQAPSSIHVICESIDPDGDASVWTGSVDPSTGIGTGEMTNGTGKYAEVEVNVTFQTTLQIDGTHSVFDFKW